jgi:hypothetical protein
MQEIDKISLQAGGSVAKETCQYQSDWPRNVTRSQTLQETQEARQAAYFASLR